ncbi:MAG: hypothetical protein KI790_08405 [Cyclobacteriaceae bacterium]|nr:hypothetical protein [Cyclobacteriaceae bacterium HetDA_MAG_MS6]
MKTLVCSFLVALSIVNASGQEKDGPINIHRKAYFPKILTAPDRLASKENLWIFLMAGQSNMAGRGLVEAQDTIPNDRIIYLSIQNQWVLAKEPLHHYEPKRTGLDCGLAFGTVMVKNLPDSIQIALVPCAVGGSGIRQWLGDSLFRGVRLWSNLRERIEFAQQFGTIKGLLWSQGAHDAVKGNIDDYGKQLIQLLDRIKGLISGDSIPIGLVEVCNHNPKAWTAENRKSINAIIENTANQDPHIFFTKTSDLSVKRDWVHLDSEGQRILGQRLALGMINQILH